MDPAQKKKALRMLTYGLYIATSRDGDTYGSGTIHWLSQCSFSPPLVMIGVQRDSSLHKTIGASHAFAIHILGKNQKDLATAFFKTARVEGNLLNGYPFELGVTGAPLLLDPPAWFECRVVDEVRRGDHTIFVGELMAVGCRRDEEPLTSKEAGFSYAG